MQKKLQYKNAVITYLRWGNSEKLVFCLHGFGETAQSFSILNDGIEDHTFIAINLPFHGDTIWQKSVKVLPEDLHEIIYEIKKKEGFANTNKYGLMGYSLGGRLALSLYENYSAEINKLILVASDGFKTNFWYFIATQTKWGNRIFKWTMNHPGWFLKMAAILQKRKLINAGISKFVAVYLHDEKVREQLYTIWIGFRKFKPNIKKIKQLIQKHNTQLRLVYGRYDKIIPYKTGEKFIEGIEQQSRIVLIEGGHQILVKKNFKSFLTVLTS